VAGTEGQKLANFNPEIGCVEGYFFDLSFPSKSICWIFFFGLKFRQAPEI